MHGTTEQMGSFILLRQPFPSPSTHCDGLYCLSRIDWRDMFVFNSGHREIVNCKGSSNQFGSIYKKCAPFFFPLVCRASLFPQNSHLTRSHYRWPKKKNKFSYRCAHFCYVAWPKAWKMRLWMTSQKKTDRWQRFNEWIEGIWSETNLSAYYI